jgi:hypothetical protein
MKLLSWLFCNCKEHDSERELRCHLDDCEQEGYDACRHHAYSKPIIRYTEDSDEYFNWWWGWARRCHEEQLTKVCNERHSPRMMGYLAATYKGARCPYAEGELNHVNWWLGYEAGKETLTKLDVVV